jgi:carbonic anhydrase/acetyltransferase-like protein (isoleucine patch superfamily)
VNIITIYALGDKKPEIALTAYVHPQAAIIGDVKIGERVFIAPMVSIRGDRGRIEIGDETNVQDGAVIHSEPSFVTKIGRRVNIGHNATIHAECIEDNAAVGMGAVLMLGSRVAEGVMIANSALLHNKTKTEPNKIYAGVPAKYMKDLDPASEARQAIEEYLDSYVASIERYMKELRIVDE